MLYFDIHYLPAYAAALGVLSHWTYFIHGEHHMRAPLYGCLFLGAIPALYLLESNIHKNDTSQVSQAGLEVFFILGAYLLSLFTSMSAYRIFFHSLKRHPGPLGARVSKLWHTWQVRHAENHLVLDKLHHKYGKFVRTGKIFHDCRNPF